MPFCQCCSTWACEWILQRDITESKRYRIVRICSCCQYCSTGIWAPRWGNYGCIACWMDSLKGLYGFSSAINHTPWWNTSAPTCWWCAIKFMVKLLFSLSFMNLNMHLLGSILDINLFVSTSSQVSVMLDRLVTFYCGSSQLAHEKFCSRAFEASFFNSRDAVGDQGALAADTRRFLNRSRQKSFMDFLICIFDASVPNDRYFEQVCPFIARLSWPREVKATRRSSVL